MVNHRLSPLCGSSRTNGNAENLPQYDLVFLRGHKTSKFDFKTCQMQCLGTAGVSPGDPPAEGVVFWMESRLVMLVASLSLGLTPFVISHISEVPGTCLSKAKQPLCPQVIKPLFHITLTHWSVSNSLPTITLYNSHQCCARSRTVNNLF